MRHIETASDMTDAGQKARGLREALQGYPGADATSHVILCFRGAGGTPAIIFT
jgi:hypothetical protein